MKTTSQALILAALALVAPVLAQTPVDPKDVPQHIRDQETKRRADAEAARIAAANAANPPKPVERPVPSVKSTDPDVQALVKLLTGTFSSAQTGDTPPLSLSTSVITVDGPGIDNAVYFELARADSAWAPFRQGVWQVWKKNGNLTVRQYDFTGVPATFKAAMVGMWAAPDMFPVLKSNQLAPTADVSLTLAGGNYSGSGTGPSLLDGAFEFSTSWIITPESLAFTDRGTDASGKQVWGPATGAAGPTFKRSTPVVKTERRAGGVVVIDFVPPSASERKLEDYGDGAGVVVGYTDSGTEFFTSNTPNPRTNSIEPYRWNAAPQGGVVGWNTGMAGVTAGTIRRIYVPTAVGFGARGNRNVPANADLIFTTQIQWVGEPKPPANPAPNQPPAGAVPATGAPPAAKPPVAPAAAGSAPTKGVTEVPANEVPEAVRKAFEEEQKKKREQQQQQQPPK